MPSRANSATRRAYFFRAIRTSAFGALGLASPILLNVVANAFGPQEPFPVAFWQLLKPHLATEACLVLVGALGGAFVFVWRNAPRRPAERPLDRASLARFVSSLHDPRLKTRLGAESSGSELPDSRDREAIAFFARATGNRKARRGHTTRVGKRPTPSCRLWRRSSRNRSRTSICAWSANRGSPEYREAIGVIRGIEERRVGGRALPQVEPARSVRSGLALIRMDADGKPKFLMIYSERWGKPDGWWFLGGTEEIADGGDLARTGSL